MAQFFSYVAFVGALLFWVGMLLFNDSRPSLAGDNAMGYALGLFFFSVGFGISLLLLAGTLHAQGLVAWIPWPGVGRGILLYGGALCIAIAFALSAGMKWEEPGEALGLMIWVARHHGQVWIPLLALAPAFMLLRASPGSATPVWMYQWPLAVVSGISALLTLSLIVFVMQQEARTRQANMEQNQADQERWHNDHLASIESLQDSQSILLILSLTGRFHDSDVRETAVAKIKERPDWENQLLEILESPDYFSHVYTFIDGNALDHPERFAEPLQRSIEMMAIHIEKSIREADNLQDWHFDYLGIERLLRAIDEQYAKSAHEFVPALEAVRQALRTTPPEHFKDVRFTAARVLDQWLRPYQKRKK